MVSRNNGAGWKKERNRSGSGEICCWILFLWKVPEMSVERMDYTD